MEAAVQTNPLGGAAGGGPPPQNLLAQVTAHAPVREAPPSTSAPGGGEGAGPVRRRGFEEDPEAGPRARGGGGGDAEARRGDVRSSWSRGLPPAADVRTVNNPERSVEGGIPGRSLRSASLQPRALPELGTVGWRGRARARRARGAAECVRPRRPERRAADAVRLGLKPRWLAGRSARALGATWAEPAPPE